MLKRLTAGLLIIVIGIATALWLWTITPLKSGVGQVDPALTFANANRSQSQHYSESYFSYKGVDLHYIEAGHQHAEVILMIHGFPQFWFAFNAQIDVLSQKYRVIAIDGLGAGRSDAPRDKSYYSLETMARHISELLLSLDIERAHVLGHDWGASLAFGFAERFPGQTQSVVGIAAPPQPILLNLLRHDESQRERSSYIKTLKRANPPLLTVFSANNRIWNSLYQPLLDKELISPAQAEVFAQASSDSKRLNAQINWYRANIPDIDQISDSDYWPDQTVDITQPAMLIWGENDPVFDQSYTQMLKSQAPQLKLTKLSGIGHSPHLEAPRLVSDLLLEFFTSVSGHTPKQ